LLDQGSIHNLDHEQYYCELYELSKHFLY